MIFPSIFKNGSASIINFLNVQNPYKFPKTTKPHGKDHSNRSSGRSGKVHRKKCEIKGKNCQKIIEETVYDKMIKEGKVSKEVINFLVQEEDVSLEDEEILLRETKKKERERVKWL